MKELYDLLVRRPCLTEYSMFIKGFISHGFVYGIL